MRNPARTVCFVSDRTGVTTETLGHALLSRFQGIELKSITMPFVLSAAAARGVVTRIDVIAAAQKSKPIVFCTIVDQEICAIIQQANAVVIDLFSYIGDLERELGMQASAAGHAMHGATTDPTYAARMSATNFALANDDGAGAQDYRSANVVLIGVSRSGKTPTCLYLALQYGVFAANYPLAEEQLETGELPPALLLYRDKLYGLTLGADRLQQIRSERRPGSRYASPQQVQYELRAAQALFDRLRVPHLDVTECSIEEIASRIMDEMALARHARS
ncbi:MAG TPA: pyruvate, water dikinase regulatory protein [Gammaproteobacteria bacterium]|nr:pyruvate, water dikinase regulatory protein [Gammaproteobacteria bacterium]